ncbi:hypothetical protein HK405_010490 [Cladochytrium tenue]|nr:hypothetical protein HK405_010490 [Cladochytrium tenue]
MLRVVPHVGERAGSGGVGGAKGCGDSITGGGGDVAAVAPTGLLHGGHDTDGAVVQPAVVVRGGVTGAASDGGGADRK